MRKTLKKFLTLTLTAVMLCSICAGFSGCINGRKIKTEYFVCREYSDRVAIDVLTDLGKEQEILIFPEKIKGKKVTLHMENARYLDGSSSYSRFASDKLKKLYLMRVTRTPFEKNGLPNLQEIYAIGASESNNVSLSGSGSQWYGYVPNVYDKVFQNEYLKFFTANVGYFYNYLDSPNNNYYWIDNYTYGGKITFQPPPPERQGYTFSGWYKEAACMNAWDFDKDTLPQLLTNADGETIYQETKLYAKWS